MSVPSGSTTSTASTCEAVTPSARQCGPPELLATLPPIEHVCWLLGSGAKCSPRCSSWRVRSRLSTPGCTHAWRFTGSTLMHRVHLRRGDHHRAVERHRPAGQAGAGTARHERHAVTMRRCAHTPAPRRWSWAGTRPPSTPSMLDASRRYSESSVGTAARTRCVDSTRLSQRRRRRLVTSPLALHARSPAPSRPADRRRTADRPARAGRRGSRPGVAARLAARPRGRASRHALR